jgi:hypothetical protein
VVEEPRKKIGAGNGTGNRQRVSGTVPEGTSKKTVSTWWYRAERMKTVSHHGGTVKNVRNGILAWWQRGEREERYHHTKVGVEDAL